MDNKIKKNYIYNLLFQILTILIPFITTPYISRVLENDGVGKYSFTFSIISYFNIFASLGFSLYGQREIAKHQNDRNNQSIVFWEIMILKFLTTIVSLIVFYILIAINLFEEYKLLLIAGSLNILSVFCSTNFLFQGNEEFKKLTIRDGLVKILIVILIFIFVKSYDDLIVYCFLNGLAPFLSSLLMIPFVFKYISKINIRVLKPFKHLKPTLKLFIPTIAASLFLFIDRTMIGLIVEGEIDVVREGVHIVKKVSDIENGCYEQADKIIRMAMMVILSLGTVMMPRNANEIQKGNYINVKENIQKSLTFAFSVGLPMVFGIILISNNIVPWFLGEGYEKSVMLMMILSPLIIIISLTNVFGQQYLLPSNKDKPYLVSIIIGLFANIVLNVFFISIMGAIGAAISSVISEFVILFAQCLYLKSEFNVLNILKNNYKYLAAGIIMFVCVFPVTLYLSSSIINTLIIILLGCLVYFISLLLLRDKFIFDIINKGKTFIKSRGK